MFICDNTKTIRKGCKFFAMPGKKEDHSLEHAKYAAEHGASEILAWESVCKQLQSFFPSVKFTPSYNPRAAYTKACREQVNYAHKSKIIGITGTKGKTSLAWMINKLLHQTGYIGTLGSYYEQTLLDTDHHSLTCPTPMNLYKTLQQLEQMNAQQIALEYTSIAIDSMRFLEEMEVGVLTNFTGDDHLIFHNTVENYRTCKLMLFDQAKQCLINACDPILPTIQRLYSHKPIHTYSSKTDASLCHIKSSSENYGFDAEIFIKDELFYKGSLKLLGQFQLDNLAGALSASTLLNKDNIIKEINNLDLQIPGRMEIITTINSNTIIVDYAHTPNSLKQAIEALKLHKYENIIIIFGCGGDRDWAKRPIMGQIASSLCDQIILTDDNPRTENPANIRTMIMEQCPNAFNISNREEAIELGLKLLSKYNNSALLIAGKGHEKYQIIGTEYIPFSDKSTVLKHINIK